MNKKEDIDTTEPKDESVDEATEESTDETEAKPETEETEEASKSMVELAKKLGELAYNELKGKMAADVKKGLINEAQAEKAVKPEGMEKVKQFFTALFDGDRVKLDSLSSGTGADGGFLVPQEYANDFVIDRRDATVMRRAGATQVTTASNTFNVPTLGDRPRVYWTAELAAKSSTSATWANITLTPYTLAAIMTVSNQAVQDAKIGGNIIDVVTGLMTQAIAEAEDKAFFTGSGSGQPTGLTTYTVSQIDAIGAINGDKLINALYTLPQGYRKSAGWFMNARTIRVVRGLKDSQNRYLFVDALTSTDFPTLLGLPVYEQNDIASSQIWVGDPSLYWIADRTGIAVDISTEASVGGQSAFERNFTAVRVEERVDGELTLAKAFVEIINTGVS